MIGSRLVKKLKESIESLTPSSKELDLTVDSSITSYFCNHPEIRIVIHLAAYTNVSESQKQNSEETSPCYQLNVLGTKNLVGQIRNNNIYMIHVSTDMVFPGDAIDPGPYTEDHLVYPDLNRLTWYGYTKALAEQTVMSNLPSAAVVRLIYPVLAQTDLKSDYLRAPLVYYATHQHLYPIFADQWMNITDVDEFALVIDKLLEKNLSGIFHASSSDITTPYKIMVRLFDLVYGHHNMIKPGSLTATRYPQFGGLLNQQTGQSLGICFSSSNEIIDRFYRK